MQSVREGPASQPQSDGEGGEESDGEEGQGRDGGEEEERGGEGGGGGGGGGGRRRGRNLTGRTEKTLSSRLRLASILQQIEMNWGQKEQQEEENWKVDYTCIIGPEVELLGDFPPAKTIPGLQL